MNNDQQWYWPQGASDALTLLLSENSHEIQKDIFLVGSLEVSLKANMSKSKSSFLVTDAVLLQEANTPSLRRINLSTPSHFASTSTLMMNKGHLSLKSFDPQPLAQFQSSLLSTDVMGALKSFEVGKSTMQEDCDVPDSILADFTITNSVMNSATGQKSSSDTENTDQEEQDPVSSFKQRVPLPSYRPAVVSTSVFSTAPVVLAARKPFSASVGVENFLRLRGQEKEDSVRQEKVSITLSPSLDQIPTLPSRSGTSFPDYSKDLLEMCQSVQNESINLHHYMASSVFVQNGDLVALLEQDFQIELIEREMGSNALILDPNSVILICALHDLPKLPQHFKSSEQQIKFLHETPLGNQLLRLSAHFSMICLVVEGVNSSQSSGVYSFTSPVIRSLASLNLFSSLILGRLNCNMDILFSSSSLETACLIR